MAIRAVGPVLLLFIVNPLLSADEVKTTKLFKLDGGAGQLNAVAFSPDGRFLAMAGAHESNDAHHPGHLLVWDLKHRHVHFSGSVPGGQVSDLAFDPQGKVLAAGSANRSVLLREGFVYKPNTWNVGRGSVLTAIPQPFSKRGAAENLSLWNVARGSMSSSFLGQKKGVTCLSFSADGRAIATGSFDGTIQLRRGFQQHRFVVEAGGVHRLDISSDGKRLAVGCFGGQLEVWNLETLKRERSLRVHNGENQGTWVKFHPDGRQLAIGIPHGRIELRESDSFEVSHEFSLDEDGTPVFGFSPDGRFLAASAGQFGRPSDVVLWMLKTKQVVAKVPSADWVSSISLSPVGTALAFSSYDGTATVWQVVDRGLEEKDPRDVQDEAERPPLRNKIVFIGARHPTRGTSCILTMNPDGTDLSVLHNTEEDSITGGRVSPDARRVAYCSLKKLNQTHTIWVLLDDGRRERLISHDLTECLMVTGWSPDGKQLVAMRETPGKWETLIIDVETKHVRVVDLPPTVVALDWAPQEEVFVAVDNNEGSPFVHPTKGRYPRRQLRFVTLNGAPAGSFSTSAAADNLFSRFSPDGRQLVHYLRHYETGEPVETAVVVSRDGTNRRELLRFADLDDQRQVRPDGSPCWSPDGEQIVWRVTCRELPERDDRYELVFVTVDEGKVRRLPLNRDGITAWGTIDWR